MSAPVNTRWSHVGLNCQDMDKTEDFYTRWLGFRRARVVEDGGLRVVFLRHGDAYLELFSADRATSVASGSSGDGPHEPGSLRHIAFQVDDVDGFLARADGELDVSLGPLSFDAYIPGWKTVWITDPDGVVVEISQGYTDQALTSIFHAAGRLPDSY